MSSSPWPSPDELVMIMLVMMQESDDENDYRVCAACMMVLNRSIFSVPLERDGDVCRPSRC